MSNYTRAAYHPRERVVRAANWVDNYFGPHAYGVIFSGDENVYRPNEVEVPLDKVFVAQCVEQDDQRKS